MRLIDADVLKRRAQKAAIESWKMKIEAKVETVLNQFIDWIDEAPTIQAESHWIPCSERLPEEERREYWICTDTGYQCECRWTNVNHFWTNLTTSWHWHITDIPQYTKVVAWRELPEPWGRDK